MSVWFYSSLIVSVELKEKKKKKTNPLLISQPSVIFNIFCPKGAMFFS